MVLLLFSLVLISRCASCLFPSKLSFIFTFHGRNCCGVREKQVSWAKLMCTSCLCFHLPSPWAEHMRTCSDIKFLPAKILRAVTEEMLENSLMHVFNAVLAQSVIIKYKGEGAVKRSEVQVLFLYHWLLLLVSLLFVVCVALSAPVTGCKRTLFCFLDKAIFPTSIPTKNHRDTWSAMSNTPFILVLSSCYVYELPCFFPWVMDQNWKQC